MVITLPTRAHPPFGVYGPNRLADRAGKRQSASSLRFAHAAPNRYQGEYLETRTSRGFPGDLPRVAWEKSWFSLVFLPSIPRGIGGKIPRFKRLLELLPGVSCFQVTAYMLS